MKKSMLILTDLGENALHAAELALQIAVFRHLDIMLLNCNNTISAITYYPLIPVMSEAPTWFEERNLKLKEICGHLKAQLRDKFSDHRQPKINFLIREGDLQANVEAVIKEISVDMIVMGHSSGSTTDHFLFGSDTKAVVEHSSVPVLIVPSLVTNRAIVHLTFATNFSKHDANVLDYLARLRKQLDAQLEIVHIKPYGKPPREKNIEVQKLVNKACDSNAPLIIYNEVYGKNVVARLNHYCKEKNSDILVLSYEHHSALQRLLRAGTVEQTITRPCVSLLIIPELKLTRKYPDDPFADLPGIVF